MQETTVLALKAALCEQKLLPVWKPFEPNVLRLCQSLRRNGKYGD